MKLIKKAAPALLATMLVCTSAITLYAKEECLETLQDEILPELAPSLQPRYEEQNAAVMKLLQAIFKGNARFKVIIKEAEKQIVRNFAELISEVEQNPGCGTACTKLKKIHQELLSLLALLKQYIGKKGFIAATELSVKLAQYKTIAPRFLQNMVKSNPLGVRKKIQELLDRQ